MAETSQAVDLRNTNDGRRFLNILWLIATLALLFCILGIVVDWFTASASYFEDGVVWIYDSLIYGLVAISFGRGVFLERTAAITLSLVLAVAGCHGSYDVFSEIVQRGTDVALTSPISASVFAAGTILEAALLFRYRKSGEPLMKGAWLSARNSAVIGLAGAATPLLFRAPTALSPQVFVDCLDAVLALQAAFFVARETIET